MKYFDTFFKKSIVCLSMYAVENISNTYILKYIRLRELKTLNKIFNKIHCGSDVETTVKSKYSAVYTIYGENGTGEVTAFDVLPGIVFVFQKFNMDGKIPVTFADDSIVTIKYCKKGRMENFLENKYYCYIKDGDYKISGINNGNMEISFPVYYYEGLTIMLDTNTSNSELCNQFKGFDIDIKNICEKFSDNSLPFVIFEDERVNRIFEDIYNAPENIRLQYYRIKLIELLYYLSSVGTEEIQIGRPYFYERLVSKIKSARTLMISDLTKNYTIEELAEHFEMGLTQLKMCFKTVYGSPISTYMRIYRLNYAAYLLRTDKDIKISDIAGRVGYDSPSKFTSAFKKELGITPFEYRKTYYNEETEKNLNIF